MKFLTFSFLIFCLSPLLFSACEERKFNAVLQKKAEPSMVSDTIIGTKPITNEIAGSAFRKRAKRYFVIVKQDTSDFQPIFSEYKDGGNVGLSLDLPYSKRTITYRQLKQELNLILPAARKDFNLDSLNSISYGRLILSGDLAVAVSLEYLQIFGIKSMEKMPDYRQIHDFLQGSTLVRDVNTILKPYSLSVKNVSFEKAFFTNKGDLYWASKVETDSAKVPAKILDCITFVTLKSIK